MSFLRENTLLVVLIILSALVIFAGVFMIHQAKQRELEQERVQKFNQIANEAAQALMQTVADSDVPIQDIKPAPSVEKAEQLKGTSPVIGSDDWCELMMAKDSDAWTEQERGDFAKHCI